jgi:hypothetical protein
MLLAVVRPTLSHRPSFPSDRRAVANAKRLRKLLDALLQRKHGRQDAHFRDRQEFPHCA